MLEKIIIWLRIDKIIDSIRKYKRDKRKRQDLEQIRNKKDLAYFARITGLYKIGNYFDNQAKIIGETLEK